MNAIQDKIEKLLRLASSSNRHEAELAMQKATELAMAHDIELSKIDPRERVREELQFVEQQLDETSRLGLRDRLLLGILSQYSLQAYTARSNGRTRIYLFGRKKDLDLALFLHGYLSMTAERLWTQHRRQSPDAHKNSYICGVLHGIYQKIREQKQTTRDSLNSEEQSRYALYVQNEDQLRQEKCQELRGNLRKTRHSSASLEKSSFTDGVTAGHKVELNAGLNAHPQLRLK